MIKFVKFVLVGFLNTAIDFGVLNLLIFTSGEASGIYFSIFKAVSFAAANINSYVWNRLWVFESEQKKTGKEYAKFLVISVVGAFINVGIASLVVNFVPIQFGLSATPWANVGAAAGTAAGLFWNFFGYKFVVFKDGNRNSQ